VDTGTNRNIGSGKIIVHLDQNNTKNTYPGLDQNPGPNNNNQVINLQADINDAFTRKTIVVTPEGGAGDIWTGTGTRIFNGTFWIVASKTAGSRNVDVDSVWSLLTKDWTTCYGCTIRLYDGGVAPPASSGLLGGPVRVRLYGNEGGAGNAGFGIASTRSSGYHTVDTAGLIPSGSLTPSSRSLDSTGGVNITVDGSRLFSFNFDHRLLFGLTGDYRRNTTDYGASPFSAVVPIAGSLRRDTYGVLGSVEYAVNNAYLRAWTGFDWSHGSLTDNTISTGAQTVGTSAQGSFNGRGYSFDLTVGNWFPLFGTYMPNPMKTRQQAIGGYMLYLDVSGHGGYRREHDNGFADSIGFLYGDERLSYGYVGGRIRLIDLIRWRGWTWLPYIGVNLDRQVGYSHTYDIPAQTGVPADTFYFGQSRTFWTGEMGLDVLTYGSARVGMKTFYTASADTHAVGGTLFLKVPLWWPDSGIRIVSGR
jgi:hypothetical protein